MTLIPMTICLVSKEYPPETGWGGIGTYTYNIAQGFAASGRSVHVITYTSDRDREYLDGQVHVHRIRTKELPGLWRWNKYFPFSLLFYSRRVSRKIEELERKYNIEVIESPEWQAEIFWYLFKRKKPVIVRLHTPKFLTQKLNASPKTMIDKCICWLEKYCILHADYVTSPSRALAEVVCQEYALDIKRVEVIANPLDCAFFAPGDAVPQAELNVLYTGRLERRKGVHVLAKALPLVLAKFPKTRFTFVGKDGSFFPKYNSMRNYILEVSGNPENIIFVDHLQRQDLLQYYRQSDLCVVPSLWEAFGYTCLEAMACGKPVVATASGGIVEIVEHGRTGLLVQPDSSESLAQNIIALLADVSLRQKLGRAAREAAEQKFSQGVIATRMAAFYKRVVEEIK